MADSIAEKILANIKTTLEGITIAAGYNNTVQIVYRDPIAALDLQKYPAIFIAVGSDDTDPMAKSVAHRSLNFTLEIWIRPQKDISKSLESIRADVQKAMMVDPRRGTNAVNTLERSSFYILIMGEIPEAAVQVGYTVEYRTKIEDPTTAPA